MLKKLTVLLSVIAATATVSGSAVSASSDISEIKDTLEALGIVFPEMLPKITKDDYINGVSKLLFEEPSVVGTPETIARNTGMIEIIENYDGGDIITVEEALKYSVVALGYKSTAQNAGGYTGVAASHGLTDGIDTSAKGGLNADTAARIVYNMLDVEPQIMYRTAEGFGYSEVADDETLLSLNRDIYEVEGVMTSSPYTSIYADGEYYPDCISVGDEFYISEKPYSELLGMNVKGFVKETTPGEFEVVYIGNNIRKNKEITVSGRDIEYVSKDFSKIVYYSGNTEKNAKLTEVPKIIYNGKYYGSYIAEDLKPEIGSLRLVDNNSDSKYDIVFVESYDTMVISSAADGEIYSKYGFGDALRILDTNENSGVAFCRIYKNGIETSFDSLKNGNVLSVAQSMDDDDRVINIYVSDKTVTGVINRIDYHNSEITVGNNVYYITEDFVKFAEDTALQLTLGKELSFSLDTFGNIVYAKNVSMTEYSFYYKATTDDEENYFITYLNMDNEWSTVKTAKKVRISEKIFEGEDVFVQLKDIVPQVVKMKFNSAGEVNRIDIYEETNNHAANGFTKTRNASYIFRSNSKTFGNKIYLNTGAKVIVIPEDITKKEDIEVRDAGSHFGSDSTHTIAAYDIDEFGFTDLISTVKSTQDSQSPVLTVVTKVMEVINSYGEAVPAVMGNRGTLSLVLPAADYEVFEDIDVGDVIQVYVNNSGAVEQASKVFSLKGEFVNTVPSDLYNTTKKILSGTVERIDDSGTKIKIDSGDNGDVSMRLPSSLSVRLFNPENNECTIISSGQIRAGDKVVCRITWGQIAEMIVLRGEEE